MQSESLAGLTLRITENGSLFFKKKPKSPNFSTADPLTKKAVPIVHRSEKIRSAHIGHRILIRRDVRILRKKKELVTTKNLIKGVLDCFWRDAFRSPSHKPLLKRTHTPHS